jgi:N-acetylmuramoyl-L-alanine amidase
MTRVVIEVGHGGGDPGAVVDGVAEADVTRAVAQRLAARLDDAVTYALKRRAPGTGMYAGLRGLLRALRQNPPDVVVSLHCDSSASDPQVHRATVYWWEGDANAARRGASATLARCLARELEAGHAAQVAVVKAAPYARGGTQLVPGILRTGRRAAALVEMGYLSDAHARAAMVTAAWQERAAEAIDRGVRTYLAS